jgi:hypothetical protein
MKLAVTADFSICLNSGGFSLGLLFDCEDGGANGSLKHQVVFDLYQLTTQKTHFHS